jgi:hypothetical protein
MRDVRRSGGRPEFSERELDELRVLCYQAFEVRHSGYLRDACAAVVDWYERLPVTRLERGR